MSGTNAVVVPLGVPAEARGLGLGLAALVYAFARVEGGGVGLVQLRGQVGEEAGRDPAAPVEAFVPPATWQQIGGELGAQAGLVVTGTLVPPKEGEGAIELLVFDAKDGATKSRVDAPLDETRAGEMLVGALSRLFAPLGGDIGELEDLRELEWEPLESVLRAERCAMHDPKRGGPHDRLAALVHLGRAVSEAPGARYPGARLASLALDAAARPPVDPKVAAAADRALSRAVEDAPAQVELVEAFAAVQLRLGRFAEAERRLNAALAQAPARAPLYVLLAQALRAQGRLEPALSVLAAPSLGDAAGDAAVCTERGLVLAARGDLVGAATAWRQALARDPVHPGAFPALASLALRTGDAVGAQSLVDTALVADRRPSADVLRAAVQLAWASEGDGLARAARVGQLCARLLQAAPDDAWALLAAARSRAALDDADGARAFLSELERAAPGSAPAAEAQLVRLALDDAGADLALRSTLRAAHHAEERDLAEIAARARRLATLHEAWSGWLAAAIAERRQGRWAAARRSLTLALELAPGAPPAHLEMAEVLTALGDGHGALAHALRAAPFEGERARSAVARAQALAATIPARTGGFRGWCAHYLRLWTRRRQPPKRG